MNKKKVKNRIPNSFGRKCCPMIMQDKTKYSRKNKHKKEIIFEEI